MSTQEKPTDDAPEAKEANNFPLKIANIRGEKH